MNRQQVYDITLEYFNEDTLKTNVWIDKYCLKNGEDYLESSPDDMHRRLAREFARIEQKYINPLSYEEIYDLLREFRYIIPGGSILYGAGNPYSISSLGNCFVISSNGDSIGGIFTTLEEQAQLMKRRGGVGFDLSEYRSSLSAVNNAANNSTGIVPWEELASEVTRQIAQDGRRGALMLSLDINHPDIEQFITSKDDLTKITGANISIKITDDFMKDVKNDEMFTLQHPSSNLVDEIPATYLWDKIIHQATTKAEPGVLFWDTITRESIPSCYGEEWKETSCNPCGEIPLCPGDSCRLMSINLYSFVENPFTDKAYFNYYKFKDVVYKAQRLMDDIVDLEEEKINTILAKIDSDPEPERIKDVEKNLWIKIKTKLLEGRRTGLSAISLADCAAALGLQYASEDMIKISEEIYKQFAIFAYKSSIDMAEERGAFPIWNGDLEDNNPFLKRVLDYDFMYIDHNKYGRRNISLLTIPPSGTISLLSGISSGIEPVYQLYYKRRRKLEKGNSKITFVDQNGDGWEEYTVLHPKFKEWIVYLYNNDDLLYWECYELDMTKLYKFEDSPLIPTDVNILNKFMEKSPYYKSTAYEIDPLQRVKLQATIQNFIDHSISSTLNLKENTTEETVSNIYMEAWKQGCKGITVYRENSRTGVLVSIDKKEEEFKQHDAPKRPKILQAEIYITKSKGKEWLVVVGLLNGLPYEIFAVENQWNIRDNYSLGTIIKEKRGYYTLSIKDDLQIENFLENISDEENNLTRMISTALRHGANIKFIVEQLNKSRGDITTFSNAIKRILKKYVKDGEDGKELCPECSSKLIYQNGCKECSRENNPECTYSKCG